MVLVDNKRNILKLRLYRSRVKRKCLWLNNLQKCVFTKECVLWPKENYKKTISYLT